MSCLVVMSSMKELTSIEICAGAGGQALGLELAGFEHIALVEIDANAVQTLRTNRPQWNVIHSDVKAFDGAEYQGVDLLAGGVPCPPFSIAGKQLGESDERDLFPEVLRLVAAINPKFVMIENVKGLLDKKFEDYRSRILESLRELGYVGEWRLFNAKDYGVPQSRPRSILVASSLAYWKNFEWPETDQELTTIKQTLSSMLTERGWKLPQTWEVDADRVAPTIVGGSKKHGGPDLGPTRAKNEWQKIGIDGRGVADLPPSPDFIGLPRLTVQMAAAIQGFPNDWVFTGRKTAAYRQVGNAFPPPVAKAVGVAIATAITVTHEQLSYSKDRQDYECSRKTEEVF